MPLQSRLFFISLLQTRAIGTYQMNDRLHESVRQPGFLVKQGDLFVRLYMPAVLQPPGRLCPHAAGREYLDWSENVRVILCKVSASHKQVT